MPEVEPSKEVIAALGEMVGYLNFSAGKPDPRFQRHVSDVYQAAMPGRFVPTLREWLNHTLDVVQGTSPAFQDISQARAVTALVFEHALPAYRVHHQDLLAHLSDVDLHQPFFVARVFEAVLAQGPPWHEKERIVPEALRQLNDFIGHRPVAVLERLKSEPYDHERVRPIPVFIRRTGVAAGTYHEIVTRALEILRSTDPTILAEACFDLELLDELAIDPRAYDFTHPVDQRPNYQFGEWDPHLVDEQGRYRRFVVRHVTLNTLLCRLEEELSPVDQAPPSGNPSESGTEFVRKSADTRRLELVTEAAAVLAGTILMASGTSGSGPETHDSSVTLATLVPKIARYRDVFYSRLLESTPGLHGARLREESAQLQQPFGGARQHLNRSLSALRASQLQHVRLAQLFARMGYPKISAEHVRKIPTVSARIVCEIQYRIASAHLHLDQSRLEEAERAADTVQDLLDRGIACGGIVDPWNILGFQGQFSIFPALENSVPDPRVDQLVQLVEQMLWLFTRLMAAAAGAGAERVCQSVEPRLERLAAWWDRFATVEVSGVRHVRGAEFLESANRVAEALRAWRQAGEGAGDIKFWRQHTSHFRSPRAYAQVVRALLDRRDSLAAMALLMSWLNVTPNVPLDEGEDSFHSTAEAWLRGVLEEVRDESTPAKRHEGWKLVCRFFELLEANAEDALELPSLGVGKSVEDSAEGDLLASEDGEFAAAYDGVTYHDSAEDGYEGELLEGASADREFDLDAAQERIEPRLRLVQTVAQLIEIAVTEFALGAAHGIRAVHLSASDQRTHHPELANDASTQIEVFRAWSEQLVRRDRALAGLLDAVHSHPIPTPIGSYDSLVEFDRRRVLKQSLTMTLALVRRDTRRALHCLWSYLPAQHVTRDISERERLAIEMRRVLIAEDDAVVRGVLLQLLRSLGNTPLLYVPLHKGGHPHEIVAAWTTQDVLRLLVRELPRLGLLREAFHVLKLALTMEKNRPAGREAVTEFDQLFRIALRTVVETLLQATSSWDSADRGERRVLDYLERVAEPYLRLWLEHSQTTRVSVQDRVEGDSEWERIRQFVQSYGHDLLTPKFLALGNLRAILTQGVLPFFEYQEQNQDPLNPIQLIDELDRGIARQEAARLLELVLELFVANYEEYREYNSTTAQSDYGERYFILFEFLRLKAWYERANWNLEPLRIVHEVLVRGGWNDGARAWQEAVADKSSELSESLLTRLTQLETRCGVRLRTIRDRLADRFVKPMVLDRIRLHIQPAMHQAIEKTNSLEPGYTGAIACLLDELRVFAETTTGSGLDIPVWLRVLESEVEHVRKGMEGEPRTSEEGHLALRVPMSPHQLEQQLDIWDDPIGPPDDHD